ncbi:hypothetical protein CcaCcLH18_08978 [Colletotrichum camelliae]|nr:hypothetical protein CcaCcLH18_08978 [Colletotrichum camelliae]
MVAERLGDVYEAALAELRLKGSLGRVGGTVVRSDVLNPDLFKAIRNHLVAKDMAWRGLRENKHKNDATYGIEKYDEARKAFLARPKQIGSLGDDGPTFTRLWYLIDWWLELTTDGNPVLDVENGTSLLVADLDAAPVPTTVSTSASDSLNADAGDTFARENSLADVDPAPFLTMISTLAISVGVRDQQDINVANESNVFDFASIYESLHADA